MGASVWIQPVTRILFCGGLLKVAFLQRGPTFPLHSKWRSAWDTKRLVGEELDPFGWTLEASKQLSSWFGEFYWNFWRRLVILTLWAHIFQKHCLFWSFSLFFRCRQWPEGHAVYRGCWFFILWLFSVKYLSCSLAVSPSLPISPCWLLPPQEKPREIDKQLDRGNWAILFLLWEPRFAAFIWKLSFSTSLGKSSHRPVTPKCLCWSIVPVSYWHAHWQLLLSTGIRNGNQLQSVQAAWEAGKAPRWYWHCKWRRFT